MSTTKHKVWIDYDGKITLYEVPKTWLKKVVKLLEDYKVKPSKPKIVKNKK